MRSRSIAYRILFPLAVAALAVGLTAGDALAQFGGGGGGGIGGGGGGGGIGGGGNNNNNGGNVGAAGVVVDAQGTFRTNFVPDITGVLRRQRAMAARAALGNDLARPSNLRKVSLNRLEKAVAAKGGVATEEMRCLAGLLRVKYVFLYPQSGDVVVAGPAEGWTTDGAGRKIGITTGRPVVQLQDLVVALRAFPPDGSKTPVIGCSIDPTQEGLASMQRFLRATGSTATPAQTQYIVNGLRNSLGMQKVTIKGVPPQTHFAQVLVEADYRMKLIGIGLERPPVRMVSFIEAASPAQVSRNALFRWYFVPDYQCVRASEDGLAMELVGDGVKLVGENEMVSGSGERTSVARGSRASQAFATSFTKKYPELAQRSPVYAELRNLIDLAVAAAYIQQEDFYSEAGWKMEFFGDESKFSVRVFNAPKQVESTVAAVWKGRRLMTPIGGGVQIEPDMALDSKNLMDDEDGRVARLRGEIELNLAEGQWWWD